METKQIIDLYLQRKEERHANLIDFFTGKKKYLIIQSIPGNIWGRCNSVEEIYTNNIEYFAQQVQFLWTDALPYMEPWMGTGVYANAFGCEIMWREDNAPDAHYKYFKAEELAAIEYPDWTKSFMMQRVLECIDYFKEQTNSMLPICCTDTQSPFDTASLILESVEFFTACYTHEELVAKFLNQIADLIIEFSKIQMQRIGANLCAAPGHIMPSTVGVPGLSISDDNLAVGSPDAIEKLVFPVNQKLADAFNGLAIHSCGRWTHIIDKMRPLKNIRMVDIAGEKSGDPNPNASAAIHQACKDSSAIVKVRLGPGNDAENLHTALKTIYHPGMKLAVEFGNEGNPEENFKRTKGLLEEITEN